MNHESTRVMEAKCAPGVSYRIVRMSFGRRMELAARIRELARRAEFLESGKEIGDRIDGTMVACEIDRTYLEWGLLEVSGLEIDHRPATPDLLVKEGPEELCREIVEAIKRECGLSEEERKN